MSDIKNLWVVKEPDGETRKSEAMITNTVTLVLSILAAIVAKNYDFEVGETEIVALAAAITAGIGSVAGLVLRYRSRGGTIKAKNERVAVDYDSWGV